jgi:aldehyde:ferredoxin oxidoreductase
MIRQSERVYNFQRIFNLRRGYGKRIHDAQPYRACGRLPLKNTNHGRNATTSSLRKMLDLTPPENPPKRRLLPCANTAKPLRTTA